MKKQKFLFFKNAKAVVFTIAISLSFNACDKDVGLPEQAPLNQQSFEDQVAYAKYNLKILGQAALNIANDSEFRQAIYQEIEKQFDGDYNVLFEKLVKMPISGQSTIGSKMETLPGMGGTLYKAMEAFKEIEHTNFYPQLYIPFYEELKEKKDVLNTKVLSVESEPVIVLFAGDDSQDSFPGYRLNENRELEEINFMVDEAYAQSNEVWVISLNERYSGEGDILNTDTVSNLPVVPSAIVDQIKCKCHKESWAAGKSEVNIITIASDWGFNNGDVNVYGNGANEGGRIYTFSRKDVKKKKNKDVNFYIIGNWDNVAPGLDYGNYVIFEYDAWPTGLRTATWSHAGIFYNYFYRSADSYYDLNTVHKFSFSVHSINNGCIEWSSQYQ